jgi:formate/nitrite transporter FocA (FNT family)
VIALLVGLTVAVMSLNHVIVVSGAMLFAKFASSGATGWGDIGRNFAVAMAGNIVGGFGLVTLTRVVQARGEDG